MRGRPAETGGAAGAFALLLAAVAGVDDQTVIVALGVAVGLLPAAITLLVSNGGLLGVANLILHGRRSEEPAVDVRRKRGD